MLVDEFLHDIRCRSFYMEGKLVCEVLVLFFEVSSSGWVSLTVSEGVSEFVVLDSEPKLLEFSDFNDDFAYPVGRLNGFERFLGSKVVAVYEYRIVGVDEGCIGIYLDFGWGGISIIEDEGCRSVVDGFFEYTDEKYFMCKVVV